MDQGVTHWIRRSLIGCALPAPSGLTYLDKSKDPKNPEAKKETRDAVTFNDYYDAVYANAPDHVELEVGRGGFRV